MNPIGLELSPVDRTQDGNLHRRADENADPTNIGRWSESLRERTPRAAVEAYSGGAAERPHRRRLIHIASEVMTRDVLTLRPDTAVEDAWQVLTRRRIHQAPVMDDAHRIAGLISREQLLGVMNEVDGRVRDVVPYTLVADVMVKPAVVAAPTTDVRHIARLMIEQGVPAVPIVGAAGDLLGIVSSRDILRVVGADPPLDLWA